MDFDRDFGVNQIFVDELYESWRQNPAAVDPEWQRYFAHLAGLDGGGAQRNGNGSSGNGYVAYGSGNGAQAYQFPTGGLQAYSVPPSAPPMVERRRESQDAKLTQDRVAQLIQAYRMRGHLFANIDPLGQRELPFAHFEEGELKLSSFGLTEADLDRTFSTDIPGLQSATLRQIVERLQRTYTRSIGVEYMHGEDPEIRRWLQERMEGTGNEQPLSRDEKLQILTRLTDGETLETFLHKKYIGAKRFSLEGGESLIPAMDALVEEGARLGCDEMVLGMAHRGRLNVLANVLGKRTGDIFAEFEDKEVQEMMGRGDVKYHMGYSADRDTKAGKVHLSLCFNPSHLEIVNPVVEGRARAKQDREGRDPERTKVMPVLIHGDAALAGQGIVPEVMNMANLEGYCTGGTLHLVINNQVGFTTNPIDDRSTPYCTDVARMLRAPVFHVNGEDPEAVVWTVKLAVEYRQKFHRDVLVDVYCYRKYGHNEGDEPTFTQPLMYEQIRQKPAPREIYAKALVQQGVLTQDEADGIVARVQAKLEGELEITRKTGAKRKWSPLAEMWGRYTGGPDASTPEVATSVPLARLRELLVKISQVPQGFTAHEKIQKLLHDRLKLAEQGAETHPFDWGTGEHLAFASLLNEGTPIRFSGQDARRGTFSHRHAALTDVKTGARYLPLNATCTGDARLEIYDSPLSEAGVMGFDYGFTLDSPDWLTFWEGQFGDFANGAQVVIDQFLTSAEDKWMRLSGLVLLLPHGFEGQGPEHSSARLERFLQLAAEDNIQVCNLTTPAQYFHVLRRQVLRPWRKPLVIMTPKSLLRHKGAVSTLLDLSDGGFQRVIPEAGIETKKARRVLLCSGKVFFDLLAAREAKKIDDVAIVRVEQLYPLPEAQLAQALAASPQAEVVWVQEEPLNMGSWYWLNARWPDSLAARRPRVVARAESASPATGSAAAHKYEQQLLMDQAFAR